MPRHFYDIASGADLPLRLLTIAHDFMYWMQLQRLKHDRNIDNPISCREIQAAFPHIKSDSDIRALVNFCRMQEKPILARLNRGGGYYWGLTFEECQDNIESLRERERAIAAARRGLEAAYPAQTSIDFEMAIAGAE